MFSTVTNTVFFNEKKMTKVSKVAVIINALYCLGGNIDK